MAACIGLHSGCTSALFSISMQRVCLPRLGNNESKSLTRIRSPHWLMKHNRYVDAWRAFYGLRETPLQAASSSFLPKIILYVRLLTPIRRFLPTSLPAAGRKYPAGYRETPGRSLATTNISTNKFLSAVWTALHYPTKPKGVNGCLHCNGRSVSRPVRLRDCQRS
jgi:hypothetical protein